MNFVNKILGLDSQEDGYIGLWSFTNNSPCLEDKKEEPKKNIKREPTLTELLKRAN